MFPQVVEHRRVNANSHTFSLSIRDYVIIVLLWIEITSQVFVFSSKD